MRKVDLRKEKEARRFLGIIISWNTAGTTVSYSIWMDSIAAHFYLAETKTTNTTIATGTKID